MRLIILLGDQLDLGAPVFDDAVPGRDLVVMAEVEAEVRRYPNHRQRVALFFAAMRHAAEALGEKGFTVEYQKLGDDDAAISLPAFLRRAIREHAPEAVVMTRAGRFDLQEELAEVCAEENIPLEVLQDEHFLCSHEEFADWAEGRKSLTMEYFYRWMRKRYDVLMEGGEPVGGAWNYDKDNRKSFGKSGPPEVTAPIVHRPDATTRAVLKTIAALEDEPGGELYGELGEATGTFGWAVTRAEAKRDLDHFIEHRLPHFGTHQDAMWTGRPWLAHARLSPSLNLKLLHPLDCIRAAERAYHDGHAPLNAVEGFIRQILGWREFIRGVYWLKMPDYATRNALDAHRDLPGFFWSGDTHMNCVREVVTQLLDTAYAHHIQRLMVTGLFNLLYGTHPQHVHDWYMALYIDSVEWVTLPNTIGMSQHADGGVVGTKPYVASGKYVQRMSNYCQGCRYDPAKSTGDDACPFTTLYWAFLDQHRERLVGNRRMGFQVKNLDRKSAEEVEAIREKAESVHRAVLRGTL